MKNPTYIQLFIAALIGGILATTYMSVKCRQTKPTERIYLSKTAAYKTEIEGLKKTISEMEGELNAARTERVREEARQGAEIARLRKQPIQYVTVTTVDVAECDSAKAVGLIYKIEADACDSANKVLTELNQVQEQAIESTETELIQCDVLVDDLKKTNAELVATNQTERNRKKIWRVVGVTASALLAAIVLL